MKAEIRSIHFKAMGKSLDFSLGNEGVTNIQLPNNETAIIKCGENVNTYYNIHLSMAHSVIIEDHEGYQSTDKLDISELSHDEIAAALNLSNTDKCQFSNLELIAMQNDVRSTIKNAKLMDNQVSIRETALVTISDMLKIIEGS